VSVIIISIAGEIIAPDGWIFSWDLGVIPQHYDEVGPDGVMRYTTSGCVDVKYMAGVIKRFQAEHAGQLRLW